ncbi:ABC transporter substrate-binding protein [Pseudodonghicola flavimaris]|uniref:ABC transporter substrate-binding protein n=1 Tax=Pseudodonghicola flavimaris TaxID=3050036 RepID=A0ABT7F8M8_9RHOB|nr:ABC transporter substrate-binding protein [Pseudodonghicola flavimaris]MDK3020840.1 ABC transporter substrate-binding protein [Pseudodonghicola flavimaris]
MIKTPKLLATSSAMALAGLLAANSAAAAELGDVKDPIKLAVLEWTGAQVSTQLAGMILEKAGYAVEYVPAGSFPQYSGLSDGTLSATVEIWSNNVGDIYPRALAAGDIENIGSLGLETREGWAYPRFMEEVCPGLPDWTALKEPACAAALATTDTLPNGRLLDYPADWGSRSAEIIADNDLPLTAIPAGSEGAMIAELRAAQATHSPLLLMFWGPHHVLAEIDLGWVEMPPCASDDPDKCVKLPEVEKVVWSGFADKWPAGYEILKSFQVTSSDQEKLMAAILEEGQPLEEVAAGWIDSHQDVWQPWVDAAVD